MLRAALSLTAAMLLTACASSNAPQMEATSFGEEHTAINSVLPSPKFKPMWLVLAQPSKHYLKETKEIVSLADAGKISDSELDENRGTFVPEVLNSTVLEATATQNISTNSVTGDNIVNSSAFSNAQGLVNLIQNSGNNVVIQSSTVVNLTFQP